MSNDYSGPIIVRTDGLVPHPGHAACAYFALDMTCDPAARAALLTYASECSEAYPEIAEGVRELVGRFHREAHPEPLEQRVAGLREAVAGAYDDAIVTARAGVVEALTDITRTLDAARVPDRDTAAERVELLAKLLRDAEAKRDEACEAALEPMRESIDTHRALDEVGAPPGASPAERVRALVRAPEPKHGRWLSIVGEDREIEHHATRQDAERCAREWYEDALADTGEGCEDRGLVALVVSCINEKIRPAEEDDTEYDYIIDGYDVRRLDGAATVQADHAPTLRVAVADLAAALGEDAPDTAELRAGDLVEVVAGLAARLAPRRGVSVSPIPEHLRADLWQSAVQAPGWRWRRAMLTVDGYRCLEDDEDGLVQMVSESTPEDGAEPRIVARLEPDLADPATLGCILALVRKRLGKTAVVRKVGVQVIDGRQADEWAICDTLVVRDGVSQCGPSFYGFRSEIEALVAGLWADVGGAS